MAADVAGCRGHRVRVLEHLPELARGLHRAKRPERGFGAGVLEFEQPLEVLPRKPGARADEMLYEYLLRGRCVAELERGKERGDGRLPAESIRVDELTEHERGERFCIRRDHEQRVRI